MKGSLTAQQKAILVKVAQSKTRREIALEMGLSHKTIEYHMLNGSRIIGLDGRDYAGIARWAIRQGLITACLLFTFSVLSAPIIFVWGDPNTNGVNGYRLYGLTTNFVVKVYTGTNKTVTLDRIQPGAWKFYATAFSNGTNDDGTVFTLESDPSNQLPVFVPEPPTNMAVLNVEWIGTLASTNWTDMGFFRLKIGLP